MRKFFQTFPPRCLQFSTDDRLIYRGVSNIKHIFFSFPTKNCSFMPLFSFSQDFISRSLNKNHFSAVVFSRHGMFFRNHEVFSLFMSSFSHFPPKMEHLFFLKHFHCGVCNFQQVNV